MSEATPEPAHDHSPGGAVDVLVVCTANIARSPLLARRLQAEADDRLGVGIATIDSAGVDARFGDGAAEGVRRIAASWGLDLDRHASKSHRYVPLEAVPLKIAMTRYHVRALAARNPGVASTTFTAVEFSTCLERLRATGRLPAMPECPATGQALRRHLTELVTAAGQVRPRPRWWRPTAWDIPDPAGHDQRVYDELGERFVELSASIGDALFGPHR